MTKSRLTDLLLYLLALFALLSFSAALLIVFQGFRGGYGRHDIAIVLLGLPGSALLPLIPDILLAQHTSLFNVVALPWGINCILTLTVYFAVRPFAAGRALPDAHTRSR